jgi:hypothetical protein
MSSAKDGKKDSAASEPKPSDTVLIHGVSSDGDSLAVLRARDDRIEAGIVRKVKSGESVLGELVRLKPRADFPLLCDVEVELASPVDRASDVRSREQPPPANASKLSHGGPAQVATPRYRDNWDAIWTKSKKGAPN